MLTLGREGKENSVKLKCVIRSSAQGRAHKTTKLDAEMYVFGSRLCYSKRSGHRKAALEVADDGLTAGKEIVGSR